MSKLKEHINVNIRFQRSTRIDADLDIEGNFFNGFVFHGTAENTLRSIAEGYRQSNRRTYTITGPYGTGKSTIALLLAGLLSPIKHLRSVSTEVVKPEFANLFYEKIPVKKGWFIVKTVCSFESPIAELWTSIITEAKGQNVDLSQIEVPLNEKSFFVAFDKLTKLVMKSFDGIVILFDEMGKALEFLNSKQRDLQFFQDFAEKASRKDFPILFIGFLHQAFVEYARGQTQSVKEGWSKVQGRYTDLLFNVSEDETVTLIGNSIIQKPSYLVNKSVVERTLTALEGSRVSRTINIRQKLESALPLHPLATLLLGPLSKRRFSQNERSTFGFLSSVENFGFQSFLASNKVEVLYRLSDLYDYIEANLDHLILSSPDARAWSEAKDAVERTQAREKGFIEELIKTIAILNMFGRKLGLYSTKNVLHAALDEYNADEIDLSLKKLQKQNLIIFRNHLQAYAVFEGSDIDIDEELEVERVKQKNSDEWARFLDTKSDHVVAKSYYHQVGVLRWMKMVFETGSFDINKFKKRYKLNSTEFSVFVLLTSGDSDIAGILSKEYPEYVFGIAPNSIIKLKTIINDLICLDNIARHNPNIQHDRIARRELESRISLSKVAFDNIYSDLFENASWFKKGEEIEGKRLSTVVSQVAFDLYPGCPRLYNELINRAKPSGTAVSARKKLMLKMVDDYFERDLAIKGTPPEMAMYKSCLQNLGLHLERDHEDFDFVMPFVDNNATEEIKENQKKVNILWENAFDLIKERSDAGVVPLSNIVDLWSNIPYGLTNGLIPIWILSLILAQRDSLAFYDKDVTNKFIYITGPDEEFVNKLIKEPQNVGVRYFEDNGTKRSYIESLCRIINRQDTTKTTLYAAQGLVSFVANLSGWVKNTHQLSTEAREFRFQALKANDPNKFLLEDLPSIFGTKNDDELVDAITKVCDELKSAHRKMLVDFRGRIQTLFNGPVNAAFLERVSSVENYTADSGLKIFARRLSEFTSRDTDEWTSNMISFLSGKAERNWNDSAVEKANSELVVYVERFKLAEYFAENIGKVETSLEQKDHKDEIKKIEQLFTGVSIQEKKVILMKSLEVLLEGKSK
ncbi:hypothetical protein JL830_09425 [Vibrio parahaemolyticus]|uniref:hypothetical protein n=1 Tax=Vibrio parahaemolyticus TaxID=670 RepID=UPI001B827D2E|nr:hypothetical protein [Vibrio parahaemolyticus]ELA9593020.1 hypothetical protein [Vibrio parahaemolyticus]ELA9709572.1 hypothetical protein [Vibrio parahaemolyticus]ELA9724153.1 hypothetical protein [Vibrio parahaemolyticus]MCI9699132.1 hypothetical protein [Vibrio parahaemolyticus]MCR9813055.1 hypothetical protein [Vibrio parahaemolyticus]